jgi:oligoribonuclease NrnB/cAMP/cGMP phosphodiesterase (DHH superfamily)
VRIITRSDFDGLISGALLEALGVADDWLFVHPKDIQDGLVAATENDVVANVPYIKGCGLWFDHHSSESERLGTEFKFEGLSKIAPSCARVIYEYYGGEAKYPQYSEMVKYADKMDSAQLSAQEIINPSGWVLLGFITDPRTGLGRIKNFSISNLDLMKKIAKEIGEKTIDEILSSKDVKERIKAYHKQNKKFMSMVKKRSVIIGNAVVVDLRGIDRIPAANRFLLYTMFPEQNISIWVAAGARSKLPIAAGRGGGSFISASAFAQTAKTMISVGYSVINRSATVDVGSLMLKYGGGGHKQVGTCQIPVSEADATIREIINAVR